MITHPASWSPTQRRCSTILATSVLLALAVAGCTDRITAPAAHVPDSPDPARVLGMVEVTFEGAGTPQMSASARWLGASSPGGARPDGLSLDLVPVNQGSASGIQLDAAGRGYADSGSTRYLYASFRVRNAGADSTPYTVAHRNVTFVAYATPSTRAQTAVSSLTRFDSSNYTDGALADTIARSIMPAHGVTGIGTTIRVVNELADMQAFAESDVAVLPTTTGTPLAYGFVVRCVSNCADARTLAANPVAGQYDGEVTFAVKLPIQATPADNPFRFSMMFLAVEDGTTRVTESLEEQGTGQVLVRAAALPTPTVTLLGNSTAPAGTYTLERLCRVRTAGTDPNAPAATLIDASGCTAGAVSLPTNVRVVSSAAAPGGDGTRWATAFSALQDALTCVRAGGACAGVTEIWVRQGVYYPDEGTGFTDDDVNATFSLVPGISLYGGFAGGEITRDARDYAAHVTILSGDIGQDDPNTDGNFVLESGSDAAESNSLNVVTGAGSSTSRIERNTVLDGFTITAGFGGDGAGMVCGASAGGACSPTISHVVFSGNKTGSRGGALLLNGTGSANLSPRLADVTFTGNASDSRSAAFEASAASLDTVAPEFVRTTFSGNQSNSIGGGAVLLGATGSVCIVKFTGVTFEENSAAGGTGGGAVSLTGCATTFIDAVFWKNVIATGGGLNAKGGAILVTGGSAPMTIINSTFAQNSAVSDGGAIYITGSGAMQFTNLIVWGNTTVSGTIPGVALDAASTATINSSLIQSGCPTNATCTGVSGSDPSFMDMINGDLRLQLGSPALDTGDNTVLGSDVLDLDGDGDTGEQLPLDVALQPRVVDALGGGAKVDMGAHERQ